MCIIICSNFVIHFFINNIRSVSHLVASNTAVFVYSQCVCGVDRKFIIYDFINKSQIDFLRNAQKKLKEFCEKKMWNFQA